MVDAPIALQNGLATATLCKAGGWLSDLRINNLDLLFPKQTFKLPDGSQKVRGGCHVCLPNFGPGGDSGLAQHGFGREEDWNVIEQSEGAVKLALPTGAGGYAGLYSELLYTLLPNGVRMELTLRNDGQETIRVSPGFHPYFASGDETTALVDESTYELSALSEAIFLDETPSRLRINDLDIELTASGLNQWVLWTDRLGEYVCLEPTEAGYAFLEEPTTNQLLASGQQQTYSLTIACDTSN